MLNGHSSYASQLEGFKRSDAARTTFIEDLIREHEELLLKYSEKCDDHRNEVECRRLWQGRATTHEKALNEHKQLSGSNSFVLAVIDGDGAIFQDHLYHLGKDGGADAAHQLQSEIKMHLKATYPDANVDDWSIVVQVVLNLHGLASKLVACNILSYVNDLVEFGQAFGLAQPLFSFIDAGSGKERADHKVRETLRLFLPNAQCKHVFFGPCSDNGYLPVLESYKRDYASRLTLIETRPAETGFVDLGLKRVRFPKVFRSDNLPCKPTSMFSPSPIAPMHSAPPTAPSSRSASIQLQPNCIPFVPQIPSPAPSSDSGTGTGNGTAVSNTWATVGKAGATVKTINIATKKPAARRYILLNGYDQRVDVELPKSDPGAEKRFGERLKMTGKLCNNFHLLGKCDAGEFCDYSHGARLTPGEQLVLKHKARSRSCPKRSQCREFDCTYGHVCRAGRSCALENCWFQDSHCIDPEPAKRMYEDSSTEWVPAYVEKHRH